MWLLVHAHSIRPTVYQALTASGVQLPPAFMQKMRRQCMEIATNNLDKLKELARLTDYLAQHNIIAVPYKGLVLGQKIYGSYAAREVSDIDILVASQDFPLVRKLLTGLGYRNRMFY